MTRHINAYKIPVTLPSCQPSTPAPILEYNTINHPDLPRDYFEEDISPGASNNDKEKIRPANTTGNDDENSRPTDIDKQRPITPNCKTQNRLLSELSWNFREVIFGESKFLVSTSVLDTKYMHHRSRSNNLFHPFNDQLDYALAYYFAESETTKRNVDTFLFNTLMKPVTKELSYCNADEWIEKLSVILWEIPDDKWTEHKFELESGIDKIAAQSLTIQF